MRAFFTVCDKLGNADYVGGKVHLVLSIDTSITRLWLW